MTMFIAGIFALPLSGQCSLAQVKFSREERGKRERGGEGRGKEKREERENFVPPHLCVGE